MNILALGGSSHDFSACLMTDGRFAAAIEEERITRIKHSLDLDVKSSGNQAVPYVLQGQGLSLSEIDLVIGNDIIDRNYYKPYRDQMVLMNHHLAHASSAYYPSPFEEAAILVVDGAGSAIGGLNETTTYYYAKGTEIQELLKITGKMEWNQVLSPVENSMGYFYDILSNGIGFHKLTNGKTMGLAPYGSTKYIKEFERFYTMDDEGRFVQTKTHIQEMKRFIRHTVGVIRDEEERFHAKADIAYAGQYHLERAMIKACRYLHARTRSRHLCLAGGVALNSVANYKILEETPFERIFVQPAAGDAGTAIGSAYYGYHVTMKQPREDLSVPFSPYLGKAYTEEDYEQALQQFAEHIIVEVPDDLYGSVASILDQGEIIGWFQDRSEIGPRALGNRSILADARRKDMKDSINSRIKHREAFRPFAPIVLEEEQTAYFSMEHPSYYMLLVPYILEGKRSEVPSITHADGTGRVQTVSKHINPKLHRLLSSFQSLTGTPILLNTSFNDNGEPIVETPVDAIRCFLNIDLDGLVLDRYLIRKKKR
ncbi:carbamoyltransferase [Marinicrinis lubricantis]|uniref:Carbamoyltransferase n=1 Tax=Marinicrinis lubricantis TaxID=2086470 RepID=A0ABW1IRN1_9BACL